MFASVPSPSYDLSFAEVINRLRSVEQVLGIALFGSSQTNPPQDTSDYDLLILVDTPEVYIFQMHTWIAGISADIVFVEVEVAERTLALSVPVPSNSSEGFVITWMETANIIYEKEGQARVLTEIQRKILSREWRTLKMTSSDVYAEWFWLNFDLQHIKRLAHSKEPIHLMTADIRLMGSLSQLCRVYFRVRGLAWNGEKAALRYLETHDSPYFAAVGEVLRQTERREKIAYCEQLVKMTLEPVGQLWSHGSTALYLKPPSTQPEDVERGLLIWTRLLHL